MIHIMIYQRYYVYVDLQVYLHLKYINRDCQLHVNLTIDVKVICTYKLCTLKVYLHLKNIENRYTDNQVHVDLKVHPHLNWCYLTLKVYLHLKYIGNMIHHTYDDLLKILCLCRPTRLSSPKIYKQRLPTSH